MICCFDDTELSYTSLSICLSIYLSIYLGSYPPSSECHKFEFPKWDYNEAPKGTIFAQLSLICTNKTTILMKENGIFTYST